MFVRRTQPGEGPMTTASAQAPATDTEAVAHARQLLEELNAEAAGHSVWVRTQANAPSQRAWFTEPTGTRGAVSDGRVGTGQLKTEPCLWRWNDFEPFLR